MVSAAEAVGPATRMAQQLALAHVASPTRTPILVFPDVTFLGNRLVVCLRPSKR